MFRTIRFISATYRNFKQSIGSLDPYSRIKKEHRGEFETEFLNDQQRKRLKVARDYALEKQVLMWQWWKCAGGEIDAEMKKEIASKRKIFGRKPAVELPTREEAKAARKWLEGRRITG